MHVNSIIALISRIKEKADALILKELKNHGIKGIVPSHGNILSMLFYNDRQKMKDLAMAINRDKSTLTVLVNKLVKLGYLKKEPDAEDGRAIIVSLTDKGKAIQPAFREISVKLIETTYGNMKPEDRVLLMDLLEVIAGNFINWENEE